MKLATLRDGSRDGRLVVVSRDLTLCSDARHIAPTLQAALDAWPAAAPQLELIARGIETGGQPVERFHEREAHSPLPVAAGRGVFADPRGPLPMGSGAIAAGIAAIVGDVPADADEPTARAAVRLVMLAGALGAEDSEGTSFSPVAVTPDEVGAGLLVVELNGALFSRTEQRADAGSLVAGAAQAGSVPGGIVGPGLAAGDAAVNVPLRAGDTVRIEMRDPSGHSIFGAIERAVA